MEFVMQCDHPILFIVMVRMCLLLMLIETVFVTIIIDRRR